MIKIPDDVSKTDVIVAIQEWILGLHAERNKKILYMKLIKGATFSDIAEKYKLSDRRVQDIVYKGCNIIFKHIRQK